MRNLVIQHRYDTHDIYSIYHAVDDQIIKDTTLTKIELLHKMAKGIDFYSFCHETMQYTLLHVYHKKNKFYLRTDTKKLAEDSMFVPYDAPMVYNKTPNEYRWAKKPTHL